MGSSTAYSHKAIDQGDKVASLALIVIVPEACTGKKSWSRMEGVYLHVVAYVLCYYVPRPYLTENRFALLHKPLPLLLGTGVKRVFDA